MEEKHEPRKKPNFLKRFLTSYRKIPDKKPYIEFVTAILSIPVLLTVILLNLNSLTGTKDKEAKDSSTPAPQTVVITAPASNNTNTATSEKEEECTPEIGPIEITAPEEGETVTDNPVFVSVKYEKGDYCSVVWSYRINGGRWSDYDDKSIALYNPPPGTIRFELRIKSVVSDDSLTLTRSFTYQGTDIIQTTPTASSSAN